MVDSGCGLERIPLELDHPDIAEYLLGLRETLEKARNDAERNAARRSFAELAPPELTGR